ncbi:MAG: efflux RND transporter periplasmic adaptor subunit [Verrucomicrobia bacterium]|nr:efflux RND transporter periplasmic adaptor subunit [Verrucomicrobiota bacterium]
MLSGTPPRFPFSGLPLLCGAALLLAGCSQKKSAALDLGPPVVLVTEATKQDVPDIREWVGSLDGSVNADVRAQVSGRLISRDYKEGSLVQKGELLFQLDPSTYQAALEQAKANLAQAQANQLQTDQQEKRMVDLYNQKVESKQDRDNAVQANTAAKATVQANQAAVDQAQINLNYCKVVAPLTGISGFANPGVGALVSPSDSQPLTTISVVDPIRAYFYLSEQDYLKVAKWRQENPDTAAKPVPVHLFLADGSTYGETGTVDTLDRSVDNQTGTIRLAASFPNSRNILRPGQFVRVRIEARTFKDAVVVPQRAVNQLQTSYELAVVGPDNKAEIRAVEVGDQFDSSWVIESGVKPGEHVIVEGFQKVKDGEVVKPEAWNPNPSASPKQ